MAACIKAPRSVDIAHKNNNVQYKSIIQVYTDWANHYLEKARCRKTISDLQTDLRDGTVLADLIEAVTGQRVAVVHRRPKTSAQMTENLGACLAVLGRLGVALDGVAVKDVREGNLKSILTMFFALSKYKQQQKQQQQQQRMLIQDMSSSRLPSPFQGQGAAAPNATGSIRPPVAVGSPSKCTSASSSRSTSPSNSFILTPRSRLSLNDKKHPTSTAHNVTVRMPGPVNSLYSSKSSSGDRLKILHPSDKSRLGLKNTKRTSSSSGFSSARSERSDSSTSLCNEVKSVPEKKEPLQNDLSLRSGLKKKALKPPGDSRLPSKTSGVVQSSDRPAPILEVPAGKQELTSCRSSQVQTPQPCLQRSRAQGQETPLSEKMSQDSVKVSEVAKSSVSGIPKPTAAVKGMTKPTHFVAPMPQVTKDKKQEPNNLQKGGVGQLTGEEEESVEAVKPMQPLLRGYKSNITISARPAVDQQTGYMSDGDILNKSPKNDISDGYISEGGAVLYSNRDQERLQPSISELSRSTKHSIKFQTEVKKRDAVSDEVKTLSGDDFNHFKRGGVTGPGGSGRSGGPYDPPLSPPEPQPVVYRVVGSRSHIKKADSSQQTENSAFSQVSSTQWKKYMDGVVVGMGAVGKMPELSRHKTDLDVNRKPRPIVQAHNGLQRKSERKRITGSKEELGLEEYTNGDRKGSKSKVRGVPPNFGYIKRTINGNGKGEPRTAQVSAVPRTKVKVSGGTQTDLKSYSVGGSTGAQLSASVRERLMQSSQSLPKARTDTGSLSDSNYAELSPYSVMYRHTTAYTASLPARATAGGLIEADSVESLPVQLHHRASLTHPRLVGPSPPSPSPSSSNRLSRSNSIRSTKSEKLYLQRSDEMDPYYSIPYSLCSNSQHSSQPTSPTPTHNRFNYPTSPISGSPSNHMISRTYPYTGLMSKVNSKDDDVHGSAVSLVSTASSLYSTPEEKQAHELRKLRRELSDAQDKVHTLTSQLSTNAHVVSAFEQSLSNMTQRLQQLTATAEKKDSELMELRQTIELLRKQSLEAGLTSGHHSPLPSRRHTAAELTSGCTGNMARQLSTDSVSSLNSLSSACSLSSAAHNTDGEKKKKRGWLRSSFNKAFSRTKKNRAGSVSDVEDGRGMNSDLSAPSSPLLGHAHLINGEDISNTSDSQLYEQDSVVDELRKQLREKDLVLTDIRLEALSSAHQLESLKDTVIKMRNEMLNLKQDNERLQRIVTSKSLTSSQSSLPLNEADRRLSMGDMANTTSTATGLATTTESVYSCGVDGKRVMVAVYLGSHGSYHRYVEEEATAIPIATISVSSNTKWDALDAMVHRAFKDYCEKIDQLGSLGLDCIWSYHVGEVVRYKDSSLPDLLPCGYLVGETNTITVCLKGALHNGCVDALVFETLIPKSIVHRYISLLNDHRRIILCGPSGTGKSHLASKLAEFLVLRAGKESTAEAIATFNVEGASSKELRGYLSQCERDVSANELPSVIILDNLQHAASLGELFHNLLSPYIIGTMRQATGATTNLQLHHNFRWVLCANHMEPVSGLLGRCLARRLLTAEISTGRRNADLARVVEWLPRVWHHLNQFLETHSSSDFTTGPRLFLTCPMDVDGSQVWFTDLWNYSVVPYLVEAVREGLRLYGCRAPFDDPSLFICQTYPWLGDAATPEALIRLRPEDVGYEMAEDDLDSKSFSSIQNDSNADPLLNMLMRLQEAANYSSPPDPAPAHSQTTPSASTGVESNL